MTNKNIITDNEMVKKAVRIHTTIKTLQGQLDDIKNANDCGTYIYQGVDSIPSCVTISEVTKTIVREGCEDEYNDFEAQIKELKARQALLTERIVSHKQIKITKAPKGLNK